MNFHTRSVNTMRLFVENNYCKVTILFLQLYIIISMSYIYDLYMRIELM